MLNFVFILIYIFIIFFISSIFKRFNPNNKEVLRKIIHIGIGPLIPLAIFLNIDRTTALFFTGFVSLLTFINYQSKLFPTIEDVDRKSFGTLFYCLSLFILIYLYWNKDPTSLIAGFFIMTFGDGFAGLIGKNFQSKSWFLLNQKKILPWNNDYVHYKLDSCFWFKLFPEIFFEYKYFYHCFYFYYY